MERRRSLPENRARFEALYEAHYRLVYAYVHRRLVPAPSDVPDIVAEVFAVAWRRIDTVPGAPEDRLWLYGVARRCLLRHQRSRWRRHDLQDRLRSASVVADRDGPSIDPVHLRIRVACQQLRPLDREVLFLVVWERLTHTEAAAVLGCTVNAVALRMHRAKRRLREQLEISSSIKTPARASSSSTLPFQETTP
jgi:RNA polymerase sigma factor (sigma-70 family)